MSTVLTPKDITGTTRFSLDFKLTFSMFKQLLKEFNEQGYEVQNLAGGAKLINYSSKEVIEINREFVSFSPILDSGQKEEARRRIYKHVAKRAEVYTNNSFENLELAKKSLLGEELRSCASLLYYSYHKFFNGQLYRFLNLAGLEDFQIEINEMEHYTSAIFKKYEPTIQDEILEVDEDNYKQIFCTNGKKRAANPLVLKKYLFKTNDEEFLQILEPYISFLLLKLANIDTKDDRFLEEITREIDYFLSLPIEETSTEMRVKASVLTCIKNANLENEKRLLWYIYAISLRLYWLRQTADYDFDFEVNTSVREMSLLLRCINKILESTYNIETEEDGLDLNHSITTNIKYLESVSRPEEIIEDSLESVDKNSIDVHIKFPKEVSISKDVKVFATKLHLNAEFDKETIITALNFTPYVSNQGKQFMFYVKDKFNISLLFHINDYGRWLFWFEKNNILNLNQIDLQEAIDIFFEKFQGSYKTYHGTEFESNFLSTKPIIYSSDFGTASFPGIINSYEAFFNNRLLSLINIKNKIRNILGYKIDQEGLILESIVFSFDITTLDLGWGLHNTSSLPRILNDNYYYDNKEDKRKKVYIDILLIEDEDYSIEDLIHYKSLKKDFESKINNFDGYLASEYLIYSANELKELLLEDNKSAEETLKMRFSDALNDLSFNLIVEDGVIDANSFNLIEEAIRLAGNSSFPFATKGLWFLRNSSIEVGKSLVEGKEWYKIALNKERELEKDNFLDLYQRYCLELCHFYLFRDVDLNKALEYLKISLSLGEDTFFYEEAKEFKENFFKEETFNDLVRISVGEIDIDSIDDLV